MTTRRLEDDMDILKRHAVTVSGSADGRPLVFAHGYGCDRAMWRYVAPAFEDTHRSVLFDHIGHGHADASTFDTARYSTLDGYAQDIVDICSALDLTDAVLVAHSVSCVIGALAAIRAPDAIGALVMIGPSPRYIDDGDYRGGFSRDDIDQLLEAMDHNFVGWSRHLAGVVLGRPDRPELEDELHESFCRTDPEVARHFARTTFLSDNREDLPHVPVPTLVMQVAEDSLAPVGVGEYVHARLPDSRFEVIDTVGHCPHLTAPEPTIATIRAFLQTLEAVHQAR